ncbi:MAG TPA: endolytic transglycosylase MltG [Candidatus Dormibacteraeota bacterium]|nr:endolytic transglycosylase MltG [Candidatus Dormibacteraeota bacterium]
MRRVITIVLILALLGLGASRGLDWWNFNVNTPVSTSDHSVAFHVDPGETPTQIGTDLFDLGLIRSTIAFDLYTRLTNAGPKFEAGTFKLNTNMTLSQIVSALQHGRPDQIAITFKEGLPLREQAKVVDGKKLTTISGSAYLQAAKDLSLATTYKFLPAQSANPDFPYEGYLFPDTYLVDPTARAKDLVQEQLGQFAVVFSADWQAQIAQATSARPAEDIRTIVILASMVDREANEKTPTDRGNVCSVYYNRLKINMSLGVDATLLYALGRLTPEPTAAELVLDTPYNTRKHTGLPPGPISNPGKAALTACVSPPKTDYLFYFTDRQGTTHFETNQKDFESDKQKYGVSGT